MSKVEELRERLIQAIGTYGVAEDKGMPSELCETLDSLISAAQDEGRAEGAEQERERIRKAAAFKEKFERAVHEYIEETNCPMPFIDVERAWCSSIIAQIDRENPEPDEGVKP